MAGTEKVIQYVLRIDPKKGEAVMQKMLKKEDGERVKNEKKAERRERTRIEQQRRDNEAHRRKRDRKRRREREQEQEREDREQERKNKQEAAKAYAVNKAQNIGQGLVSGFAQGASGNAMGMVGSIAGGFGGPVGNTISALASMGQQVIAVADVLKEFSGDIYASSTNLDYTIMGLKFQLGEALGPAFADLLDRVSQMTKDSLPSLIAIGKVLIGVTGGLVDIFGSLLRGTADLLEAFKNAANWVAGHFVDHEVPDESSTDKRMRDAMNSRNVYVDKNGKAHRITYGGRPGTAAENATLDAEKQKKASDAAKALESQMQMTADGHAVGMALFNAANAWSLTSASQGMQGGPRSLTREGAPTIGGVSAASPPASFVDKSKATPGESASMPRPTAAAISFRMADSVQITAADEQRIHLEMMQWREAIVQKFRSIFDSRAVRLAVARNGGVRTITI